MKTIALRNLQIGRGCPKIIVPIVESSMEGIIAMGKSLAGIGPDAVEWRADYYDGIEDEGAVLAALKGLRLALGDIPLIFTCRTAKEGGRANITEEKYALLNRAVLCSGHADAVDIEALSHERGEGLISEIRKAGQVSIGSCHITDRTPCKEETMNILRAIQDTGADITKLAVMAENYDDAFTLMLAAREAKKQGAGPIIAIAMGEPGIISRILAEMTGSAAVFASVGRSSAPGQLSLGAMKEILKTVHENIG